MAKYRNRDIMLPSDIKLLRKVGYRSNTFDSAKMKIISNVYVMNLDRLSSGLFLNKDSRKKEDYDFSLIKNTVEKLYNFFNGKRVVLVSKYLSIAGCVKEIITNLKIKCLEITGKLSPNVRKAMLDKFNQDEYSCISCTYSSMTYGFSVYRVNVVVLMDPCYSYETYKQFLARMYRLNDDLKSLDVVFVYFGVQENSVDKLIERDRIKSICILKI